MISNNVWQTAVATTTNTTILVVREENLWQDWTSANQWLGQDNVATFPKVATRNFSHMDLPVNQSVE
jgi:hypothetical protein